MSPEELQEKVASLGGTIRFVGSDGVSVDGPRENMDKIMQLVIEFSSVLRVNEPVVITSTIDPSDPDFF